MRDDLFEHKPEIVSPVMRYIGVADVMRSIDFYQNILGFNVKEVQQHENPPVIEMLSGPARLQLGTHDAPPDNPLEQRELGSAIIFFQTNDVEMMHSAIETQGGKPSEIEKVNWIKMRMFEVRDPDGHKLWFGQSYDERNEPAPTRLLEKIMPELPLNDVPAGVAYYRDVLGFTVNYEQEDLGVMDRDDVRLLLITRTEKHIGIGSAYVYVDNADSLYEELLSKGARVQGEPISRPWGLRDFRVLDLEDNQITFGQPFE